MGRKKTTQSMGKGKARSTSKLKGIKQKTGKQADLPTLEGFYLSSQPTHSRLPDPPVQNNFNSEVTVDQEMLSLSHRIDQSNCDLIQRVERIKHRDVSSSTTGNSPTSVRRVGLNLHAPQSVSHLRQVSQLDNRGHSTSVSWREQVPNHHSFGVTATKHNDVPRPPPTLEAVRMYSDVSRIVTQLLAYYDEQAETDGKVRAHSHTEIQAIAM